MGLGYLSAFTLENQQNVGTYTIQIHGSIGKIVSWMMWPPERLFMLMVHYLVRHHSQMCIMCTVSVGYICSMPVCRDTGAGCRLQTLSHTYCHGEEMTPCYERKLIDIHTLKVFFVHI